MRRVLAFLAFLPALVVAQAVFTTKTAPGTPTASCVADATTCWLYSDANAVRSDLLTRLRWKGGYSGATAYYIGDVVNWAGDTYIATANSTGSTPPSGNWSPAALTTVDLSADTASTPLPAAKGGFGAAMPTCNGGAGEYLTCNGSTCGCSTPTNGSDLDVEIVVSIDRVFASTTGAVVSGVLSNISASESITFDCLLTTTNVVSNLIRFAVATPASPTLVSVAWDVSSASSTARIGGQISTPWVSTCTGCTTSVTSGVLTQPVSFQMRGLVFNGANAGTVSLYAAGSAATPVTLKKGSRCRFRRVTP